MKRKLISLALCLTVILAFVGCSGAPSNDFVLEQVAKFHAPGTTEFDLKYWTPTDVNFDIVNSWADENLNGVYHFDVQYDMINPHTRKFLHSWQETWTFIRQGDKWQFSSSIYSNIPDRHPKGSTL